MVRQLVRHLHVHSPTRVMPPPAFAALFLTALASCHGARSPLPTAHPAEAFVAALNANDVAAMLAVSATPFLFRTQEWASAPDGTGFVLTAARDTVVRSAAELEAFLRRLAPRVKVEGQTPSTAAAPRDSLLNNQLRNAPTDATQLDLSVFLRGFGDVEHIAIVGVQIASRRVTLLYVN